MKRAVQRAVAGELEDEAPCMGDDASRDQQKSSAQGGDAEAGAQSKAPVAVEDQEVPGQDFDGEVGGVGGEGCRGDIGDGEVVLGLADGALDIGSLVGGVEDWRGGP